MVQAASVDVLTSATLIASNTESAKARERSSYTFSVMLKNSTAGATVFLGGNNGVTAANGYPWAVADGQLTVDLAPGESLYGIAAAVTQTVKTLRVG